MSCTETPLASPKDMEGRTFATVSFSNGRTTVPYVLKQNGVDISKVKVQLLDISVLIPQLLQGAVDTAESAIPVAEAMAGELGWNRRRTRREADAWLEAAAAEGIDPARA